jgi:hypothetical protein
VVENSGRKKEKSVHWIFLSDYQKAPAVYVFRFIYLSEQNVCTGGIFLTLSSLDSVEFQQIQRSARSREGGE